MSSFGECIEQNFAGPSMGEVDQRSGLLGMSQAK